MRTEIVLRSYMNKDFPAVVNHWGKFCRISSGWEDFVKENGAEFGDYVQFDRDRNEHHIWRVQSSNPMEHDEE